MRSIILFFACFSMASLTFAGSGAAAAAKRSPPPSSSSSSSSSSSLHRRSTFDDLEAYWKHLQDTLSDLCLYVCVLRQWLPEPGTTAEPMKTDDCRSGCKSKYGKDPDMQFARQAHANGCFQICLRSREQVESERKACGTTCEQIYGVKPSLDFGTAMAFSPLVVHHPRRAGFDLAAVTHGLHTALAAGKHITAGMAARLVAMLSRSSRAGSVDWLWVPKEI
ncbi:MAG: hypothetical protein M1826_002428 [Phylliscum demangeonii]|nr:MAG: hypothetical protein M1826_002428 [Phylliscum demangeonii]